MIYSNTKSLNLKVSRVIGVFIMLFAIVVPTIAQKDIANQDLNTTISESSQFYPFDKREKKVVGSATFFAEFMPGKILMAGGRRTAFNGINLDVYNDNVLFMKGATPMVAPREKVNGFVVQNPDGPDSIEFIKLSFEKKPGFYRVLAKHENAGLYRKHIKVLDRPSASDGYSHNPTETVILDREKLYLWNGAEFAELKTKKQILQYFPEQKDELDKFIKEQDIDFKKDYDLIRLFNKINQLKP